MQLLPKEMLELFPKTALTGKTLEMDDRMHCFSTIFFVVYSFLKKLGFHGRNYII